MLEDHVQQKKKKVSKMKAKQNDIFKYVKSETIHYQHATLLLSHVELLETPWTAAH